MDFFSEVVKKELFVYFVGMSTNVVDRLASSKGDITQVLVFRDESKKADGTMGSGKTVPSACVGLTSCTLSENYIQDLIDRAAALTRRTVFLANCVNRPGAFAVDAEKIALAHMQIPQSASANKIPPWKTIYVQYNTTEDAKVHVFAKELLEMLQANKTAKFRDLKAKYVGAGKYRRRAVDPDGGLTISCHHGTFSSADTLMGSAILVDIPPEELELQVEGITPEVLGSTPEQVVALPDPNALSAAEIEGAQKRWERFAAEMKKSPIYTSKFKQQLKDLDEMGCINLHRINRAQIPDVRIDRACALFFCPYEGLKHTLGAGPINDATLIARLYIKKGYKILYLMDATPQEYYSWMDWILSNIHYEIVSYFSGHGTQTKDPTGLEDDGLSELMVFYNSEAKKIEDIDSISSDRKSVV